MLYVGRGQRGNNALLGSQPTFRHFPGHWFVPFQVLIPRWVGLDPIGLSNQLSCEAGSFSHHCDTHRFFSVRVFEALFPHAGTLGCTFCLAPHLFLLVYLPTNVGPPGLPAAALSCVLSTLLPISTPPTGLDECFLFDSLVVGLPYSLIFWQLWLFFVFKLVVVLLLVVRGGTVCLPTPPSWPEPWNSNFLCHNRMLSYLVVSTFLQ